MLQLLPNRRQAIVWSKSDPDLRRNIAPLGENELTKNNFINTFQATIFSTFNVFNPHRIDKGLYVSKCCTNVT